MIIPYAYMFLFSLLSGMRAQAGVGGIWIPLNKLELLAPYIALTILLAVAVTVVFFKHKKDAHAYNVLLEHNVLLEQGTCLIYIS